MLKRIYQVLEQTVKKEEGFEKQQKPLTQIENKEKELYKQIMGSRNRGNGANRKTVQMKQ